MSPRQVSGRLAVLALAVLGLVTRAQAQVGLSAALESDDRLRGVSISNGDPVVSLNLAYDHASGFYGGVSATAVITRHAGWEMQGGVVYAGYAGRLSGQTSWDVGAINSTVSVYADNAYRYNYTEVYAGVTRNSLSAHLYYSPSYLGGGAPTLYGELNGAWRLARRWRLFAHGGVLTAVGQGAFTYSGRTQFDGRLGVAREFGRCEVHLAWTTTSARPELPPDSLQSRNAVVLGAAFNF
jgi:uncharacterized protein (TIGR02001 family)